MHCKKLVFTLTLISLMTGTLSAATAQDYLDNGRSYLFDGTLSGIRQAHQIFDDGVHDTACPDCATNRELLFLHAVSRIAMWTIRDDGAPIDSGIEAAREYGGAEFIGDGIHNIMITTDYTFPENRYGQPILPVNAEQIAIDVLSFMENSGMDELQAVIDELELIYDSPQDRFRMFVNQQELSTISSDGYWEYGYDVEIDYGEVLMLKGMLYMLKGMMTGQAAYDTQLDVQADDYLIEKVYERMFSIQNDLLLPNPEFLKLLPTANDPNDGAAVLAQSRIDILNGLQYYLDTLDYISNEDVPAGTDPQDDELFSLDPEENRVSEAIVNQLNTLMDSLENDTTASLVEQTVREYALKDSAGETIGALSLKTDPLESPKNGFLTIILLSGDPISFDFEDFRLESGYLAIELIHDYNFGAYFSGNINEDLTEITNGFFSVWGYEDIEIYNITGQLAEKYDATTRVDLNPVFGDTARYPDPISPRELLCEFDEWNKPVAGTIADITMGGILPDWTDLQQAYFIDPQPNDHLYWTAIEPWQMIGGYVGVWLQDQLVFADQADFEGFVPAGYDIQQLYMGYDNDYLHGGLVLNQPLEAYYTYYYDMTLSYCPLETDAPDTLYFRIVGDSDSLYGELYHKIIDEYGFTYENYVADFTVIQNGSTVTFKIPFMEIPASISGRYLSVSAGYLRSGWDYEEVDGNDTHIQIGVTGTVSGTVHFPGYRGGPIFVQAVADIHNPEETVVAYTMLTEPGEFTLENIGLGFNGYIRVFAPLFGEYHIADMDAMKAQDIQALSMNSQTIEGVELNLDIPAVLQPNVWKYDTLDTTENTEDYFAFDAIEGFLYTISLGRISDYAACMTLLDRNGHDELIELQNWETQSISWQAPVSGRYYIKVADSQWEKVGGECEIQYNMPSFSAPESDVSGSQWPGVKDGNVDLYDFTQLANFWHEDCDSPYWCEGSDYNQNGTIDLDDLVTLVDEWMESINSNITEFQGEDFESGDFTNLPWQFGGNQNWRIVSDSTYNGSYSAKSGDISHNQSSQMSLSIDTTGYSSISFAYRVSSESSYDYLRFYIDGVQKSSWSGSRSWTLQTYPVSEGPHTFKWSYTKDGSIDSYSDCAWVDDIQFN